VLIVFFQAAGGSPGEHPRVIFLDRSPFRDRGRGPSAICFANWPVRFPAIGFTEKSWSPSHVSATALSIGLTSQGFFLPLTDLPWAPTRGTLRRRKRVELGSGHRVMVFSTRAPRPNEMTVEIFLRTRSLFGRRPRLLITLVCAMCDLGWWRLDAHRSFFWLTVVGCGPSRYRHAGGNLPHWPDFSVLLVRLQNHAYSAAHTRNKQSGVFLERMLR